jgi:predicted CXXCH cytochrome family protein
MNSKRIRYSLLTIAFALPLFVLAQDKPVAQKCTDCHKKTNAKTFVHEPSKESCKNCHQPTGKPHPTEDVEGFKLIEEVPQLCYTCHDPLNTKKTVHPPVKGGTCLDCHEVHSSNQKKLVFVAPPDLCFSCHGELEKHLDTIQGIHQVVKNGSACLNCHSPHQSAQPKLLLVTERDLCLKCHDKTITTEQRTISNIKNELDKNKFIHTAIIKNGCTGCHDPHGSVQKTLLKASFTNETYVSAKTKDNIALCFTCHNPGLLEMSKVADTITGFRNGDANLHFKHVNKKKGRNCVVCHAIHAAPNEKLLVDKKRFGNWDMPLRYTKTETGGSCITACHAPRTYSRVLPK